MDNIPTIIITVPRAPKRILAPFLPTMLTNNLAFMLPKKKFQSLILAINEKSPDATKTSPKIQSLLMLNYFFIKNKYLNFIIY